MRFSSRGTALLLATAVMITGPSALRADELVMMPFSCAVIGGRPVLTPSETEGHRIIGRREQRDFSACSPVDPGMCRRWVVHRFDIDCGGHRVPWTEIVANAQPGARAWVDNGQLNLRMPPRWTMDPSDPCARLSDYYEGRWRDPRMRHYCADRRSLAPPPYVAMPAGFAPMLGIDAVFVAAGPTSSSSGPPFPSAGYGPESAPPAKAAKPAPAKGHAPAAAKPVEKDVAPPKTAGREAAPQVQPAPASAPPATTAPQGTPAAPRIINRTEAEPPRPAPPATAAEPARTAVTSPVPAPAPVEVKAEPPASPASAPKPETAERPTQTIEVNLVSRLQAPIAAGALAALGILLIAAAFFVLRRREQTGAPRARDFASVSLDSPGMAAAGTALQTTPQPREVTTPLSPAIWGTDMPRTHADALAVLGIGVTPGATSSAIKKIVDGLRQSWHPDLAHDEADREIRELRSKQINAAWQILAAGGAAPG